MKTFTLLITIFFLINYSQSDPIKGKYKMSFEEDYENQNCIIYLKDSIYRRKFSNGKYLDGKIYLKQESVFLKDNESDFTMVFKQKKWGNDTIYFAVVNKYDNIQVGQIFIYPNQLIKL